MARQEVDIGIEGNDGTGDSIRESFKKVNLNFTELYAVFGLGGAIAFKNIDDVPDSYTGNATGVPAVNSTETGLGFYKFISDANDNGTEKEVATANNSVVVSFADVDPATPNQSGTLKVVIHDPHIERDPDPSITAPMQAQAGIGYTNAINTALRNTSGVGDDISTLVSAWNTTHTGAADITSANILTSKGYADDTYVNVAGDTMTGHLNTVNGATGTQVPQVQEVITRAGSETNRRMLDTLYLSDHPSPLEGFGTPNGKDDLQAVTKLYVDTQGFSSSTNIYVATTGDDSQRIAPTGQEGRSPQYAYASINGAMKRAEEIIESTPFEPGPYVQVITYDNGDVNSTINAITGQLSSPSTADAASTIAIEKKLEIQEAVRAMLDNSFPDLVYDRALCFRDVGLILNSVRLDVLQGTTVNYLSRFAGLRYNANPSAQIARTDQGAATRQSILVIKSKLAEFFGDANDTTPGTVGSTIIAAYNSRFDEIVSILNDTPVALAGTGSGYQFTFTNGTNDSVDQGIEGNPDLIEGKLIVGRTSGAKGLITNYSRASSATTDQITVQLLEPIEFQLNEELEFGNITRNNQVTVRVESGVYYEHLPIKLPENVSIKGDEFRRCVVRPKVGVSQSKWAGTYFYRDIITDGLISAYSPISNFSGVTGASGSRTPGTYQIGTEDYGTSLQGEQATFQVIVDGTGTPNVTITAGGDGFQIGETITINDSKLGAGGAPNVTFNVTATGGGYHFTHPVNSQQGKYGYHYLVDPSAPVNVGSDALSNPGQFNTAARLIELNKLFIVEETIQYINATYPSLVYDEAKCRRDTGLIVDGMVVDLRNGGRENALTNQGAYFAGSVAGQETETKAAILNLKNPMNHALANGGTSAYTVLGAVPVRVTYGAGAHTFVSATANAVTITAGSVQKDVTDATYNFATGDMELTIGAHSFTPSDTATIATESLTFTCAADSNATNHLYPRAGDPAEGVALPISAVTATTITVNVGAVNAAETNADTNMEALVDCVSRALEAGYNPPLTNDQLDVFLCNDATIVRNITVQRQGGFMMVLDPEGQILTRSPYCQTGASFSQSKGTQRNFNGGLFIDGYAGNMPVTVTNVNTAFNISVSSPTGEGLFVRQPPTPFPFFYQGSRYQVNTITNYDQSAGTANFVLAETSNPSATTSRDVDNISQAATGQLTLKTAGGYTDGTKIILSLVNGMTEINGVTLYAKTTGDVKIFDLYTDAGLTAPYDTSAFTAYTSGGISRTFAQGQGWLSGTGIDIFVQSGGNRSMLANDFTQVNDLGFGALLVNNALAELVSMFTYYCHTGYLAKNGSQIRSLGGNNSYGVYGMVAEGSDPDEIATDVTLGADMVFPAKSFRADGYLDFAAATPLSGSISAGQTVTQGAINASISNIDSDSTVTRITTTAPHGLVNGDLITIADVVGMTEVNGLQFYVGVFDSTQFDLYTDAGLTTLYDSSANTAYSSGGTANKAANATGIISFLAEEDGSGNPTRIYIHTTTGTFITTGTCTTPTSTNLGVPSSVSTLDTDAPLSSLFLYVYDLSGFPNNVSEVEILHSTGLYQPYEVTNASDAGFTLGGYSINTATAAGLTGTYSANDATFLVTKTRNNNYSVSITSGGTGATVGQTIIIPGTLLGGATTANDATITITDADSGIISAATISGTPRFDDSSPVVDGKVWKLNFGTGLEGTSENGLQVDTLHDTPIVFRHKQNFLLNDFPADDLPVRPSTAFTFVDDTTDYVYRTISFGVQVTDGVSTGTNQRMVTFDSNFRYVDLTTDQDIITVTESSFDSNSTVDPNYTDIVSAATPSGSITMGATAATNSTDGSRFIVIGQLDAIERGRLANADMLFTWGGKQHRITAYAEYNYTGGAAAKNVAVIQIVDTTNTDINYPAKNGSAYGGLGLSLVNSSGITLKGGLASGEDAEITVNISTCRATGHDMLDIGVGGYNTANYPERIYGSPFGADVVSTNDAIDSTGNASAAQVQERGKGRVFTVMTDQDGFFRVGRFFTVDQGTGSVTFNAALVLTNIDGIGFKRGVRVNEFSNDDTFTDAKGDAVPTQTAVEGYIDQRLGFDRDGATGGNVIGPGVMSLGGPGFSTTPMNSDMNLGANRITNLATPVASSDAVTKQYVDQKTDELNDIGDVTITGSGAGIKADILAFTGTLQESVNVTVGGDIGLTYTSGNTITAFIQTGVIDNDDINGSAAIAQSKLDLNDATAAASSGSGTKGISEFDSANFDVSSGFVGIKPGGVANAELANDDITIGTTTIALGGTSTSVAGMTGITFASGALDGTVNIDITGSITHTGNIVGPANSGADNGVSIGSATNRYNTMWATTFNGEATAALYADLAENYLGDQDYEPGTVVVFGGTEELTHCTEKGQTSVAGIVTTNPAHLMNSALEGDHVVGLALQGRVPCKVIGKVSKGDMLVTSAVPGYAIVNNSPGIGQVIGKAVGTKDWEDRGTVEVVVGRV